MKTLNRNLSRLAGSLTASLLMTAGAGSALAQFVSPVGTWDIVLSGKAKGVAFITFGSDYSLSGVEVFAPAGRDSSDLTSSDERYPGEEPGRDPNPPPGTNSVSSTNVLYGTYGINGWWTYDSAGRVVGTFPEIGSRSDGTTDTSVTNSVSFTAKVTPGKRISLVGSSGIGKVKYRGKPFAGFPDITGSWLGETKRADQKFYELFDAASYDLFSFAVQGAGPTYAFGGYALVSAQKKMAMHTYWTTSTNSVVRVVVGSFNPNRSIGSMQGIEDPQLKVKLKISRVPSTD